VPDSPTDLAAELIWPERLNGLPGIRAAFSTRAGGTSRKPFDALNLGFSTGDDEAAVQHNRAALAQALGFDPAAMAVAGQVHGDAVRYVRRGGLHSRCDGLVTDQTGVLLCMMAADCASVLLADAEAGVIGACHSGWRGTVARISAKTVAAMTERGARAERVRAYVSPCISRDAFEVGEEVAAQFDPAFVVRQPGTKPHVDLKAAIRAQLESAGVPAAQISVDESCTFSEPGRFFSYRLENGVTGRMMGVIGRVE
jgi:YfiH family protein